jgi:GT2 family glycosyltransferase
MAASVQTKVSVIVVNYNGLLYLDTCLDSLSRQTCAGCEIIVVDNGSTDGSLQQARGKYPGFTYVETGHNLGYAGGINAGLAVAAGDYISPLNMDTRVEPGWLEKLVNYLQSNTHVGAVCPRVLIMESPGVVNCDGLNIHVSGLGFCRDLHSAAGEAGAPQRVSGISGCSFLIRRDLFNRMGGAPAYCFMYNDDVVISWLLSLMGYDMYCLPSSAIYHRYRLSMTPDKFFHLEKNRIYLVLSTFKWPTLLLLSPLLLVIEAMVFAYSVVKGWPYPRSKLGAYQAAFREREEIARLRRFYGTLRSVPDRTLLKKLCWNLEWGQLFGIVRFRLRRPS